MTDVLGSLDPGSRFAGVAAGLDAATIDVDAANVTPVADAIAAFLAAHGVTRLIIEWQRLYPSKNPARAMAKAEQYADMRDLVRAVASRCRALGIRVADDADIRKPRKGAMLRGLVPRATWCRWIGAAQSVDPVTGYSLGVTDASVKAALERHFADRPDILAKLTDTHKRDAVGLFRGWVLARKEREAAERLERAREAEAAAKAAEARRNRKNRKRVRKPPTEAQRKHARGREERRRRLRGIMPRVPLVDRIAHVLADGPRSYGEIARALGQRPEALAVNFRRAIVASAGRIVQLPAVREPGKPGRPAGKYALTP